jgi:hypothetical protein
MDPAADRSSPGCWMYKDRRDQSEGVKAERRFTG